MTNQGYRIRDMAALSGLSDHVIRVWERRYQLFRPERTPNGYRLYTEDDLQLLLYLKAQLADRTIGELAAEGAEKLRAAMSQTAVTLPEVPEALRQQGLEILHSARCLDRHTTEELIHRAVTQLGIERALRELLFPILHVVGELWHRGEIANRGERAISWAARHELVHALSSHQGAGPPVIVACTPKEFHELGAMTVALLLQQTGWQVVYLGPDTGIEVLRLACKRRRAHLAVLSCTLTLGEREMGGLLDRLEARVGPLCPVFLGGTGAAAHAALLTGPTLSLLTDLEQVRQLAPVSFAPPAADRPHAGRARSPGASKPGPRSP